MILKKLVVGPFASNCYVVGCERTKEGVLIDPGGEAGKIIDVVEESGLAIKMILHTHAHYDHTGATAEVRKKFGALVALHKEDESLYHNLPLQARLFGFQCDAPPGVEKYLEPDEVISFGDYGLKVLFTPGHSPGGLCFIDEKDGQTVFSGDTLFWRSIGRTDLWGGDHELLIRSIREKLMTLQPTTQVYPGHGPSTVIGDEKKENPFL